MKQLSLIWSWKIYGLSSYTLIFWSQNPHSTDSIKVPPGRCSDCARAPAGLHVDDRPWSASYPFLNREWSIYHLQLKEYLFLSHYLYLDQEFAPGFILWVRSNAASGLSFLLGAWRSAGRSSWNSPLVWAFRSRLCRSWFCARKLIRKWTYETISILQIFQFKASPLRANPRIFATRPDMIKNSKSWMQSQKRIFGRFSSESCMAFAVLKFRVMHDNMVVVSHI